MHKHRSNQYKSSALRTNSNDFQFPDLLDKEAYGGVERKLPPVQKKYGKPSRSSAVGRAPSGIPGKSLRDKKRDNMVKQIHSYNEKQIAAGLPDPVEEKRKAAAQAQDNKMRAAVRDILDDMMQTIVVEVSLKLGGAMHAQQNAIKNIVDQYLAANPVINDRVTDVQNECNQVVKEEMLKSLQQLQQKIPAEVLQVIEDRAAKKLAIDMEVVEQRIDQVRAANGTNAQVSDRLRSRIEKLQNKSDQLPADLEAATIAVKTTSQGYTEMYCSQTVDELKSGAVRDNTLKLDKLKEELDGLQAKMDSNLHGVEKHQKEAMIKMRTELKKATEKKGCTIQ